MRFLVVLLLALTTFAGCVAPEGAVSSTEPAPALAEPEPADPAPEATAPEAPASEAAPAPPAPAESAPVDSTAPEPCREDLARAWHARIQDLQNLRAWTMTVSGTQDGRIIERTIAFDAARDYLLAEDATTGERIVAEGETVAVEGEDASTFRQGGPVSYADAFRDDFLSSRDAAAPFNLPAASFDVACHDDVYLMHDQGGIKEVWVFDKAGQLLQARHVAPGTDLTATFERKAKAVALPEAPSVGAQLGIASFTAAQQDGKTIHDLVVGESLPRDYSELQIEIVDAGGNVVETLSVPGVGSNGVARVTDSGLPGYVDQGDAWHVELASGLQWRVLDAWAGVPSVLYAQQDFAGGSVDESTGSAPQPITSEPQQVQAAAPDEVGTGKFAFTHTWSYGGVQYGVNEPIPDALAYHHSTLSRIVREGQFLIHGHDLYVSDTKDDAYLASLAGDLSSQFDAAWNDADKLNFLLSFVQSLPYTSDSETAGYDEYPRFPVETLLAKGSDCEDTSILFAGLAKALGWDVVLMAPPGHMAVGVAPKTGDDSLQGGAVSHDGKKYYYGETTAPGWRIGEIPSDYVGEEVVVVVPEDKPAPRIADWTMSSDAAGVLDVALTVINTGGAAADATVVFTLVGADGQLPGVQTCTVTVAAGESAVCAKTLAMPPIGQNVRVFFAVEMDGLLPQVEVSEPFYSGFQQFIPVARLGYHFYE